MQELTKIDGVACVAVFCNQFGHQTNDKDDEILNTLKYVRPGNGFEFAGDLYGRVNVNGTQAHPLFKEARQTIKCPQDPPKDEDNRGAEDADILIIPRVEYDKTAITLWSPVTRNDIAWNFEKFLFDKDGNLVKRYSRFYPTIDIKSDIEALL